MATYKLEPAVWQQYFDRVSKHLVASRAEIRVSGLDLGSQIAADDLPLEGMSYDPHDRELLISSHDFEQHIVAREIFVDEELGRPARHRGRGQRRPPAHDHAHAGARAAGG